MCIRDRYITVWFVKSTSTNVLRTYSSVAFGVLNVNSFVSVPPPSIAEVISAIAVSLSK